YKCTDGIIKVGRICAEADRKLSTGDKLKLKEVLPFSPATFSKLVQIGTNPRFQNEEVLKLLPPSYSIIYAVGQLDNEEYAAAIEQKILSPALKRAELERWRAERGNA